MLATRRSEPALEFVTVVEVGLSGKVDVEILQYAHTNGLLVVSHDVNTMKGAAEERVRDGSGISGLLLVPQSRLTRPVAESLIIIWAATKAEEWRDRIVYLPL